MVKHTQTMRWNIFVFKLSQCFPLQTYLGLLEAARNKSGHNSTGNNIFQKILVEVLSFPRNKDIRKQNLKIAECA